MRMTVNNDSELPSSWEGKTYIYQICVMELVSSGSHSTTTVYALCWSRHGLVLRGWTDGIELSPGVAVTDRGITTILLKNLFSRRRDFAAHGPFVLAAL
jgi:hypothetical protein